MNNEPLVSIITPSFNQGMFIANTIKSVVSQTYKNVEYIVVDAQSSDNTSEVLDSFSNSIDRLVCEPDNGQSDAIIKGFKLASGDLVGWINSDDILYPDAVEKIVDAYNLSHDSTLFYNSNINIIDKYGKVIREASVKVSTREQLLRENNTLIQPGSFYSRKALVDVGYFSETLRYSMDLDLWLRLLVKSNPVDLNTKPIAGYREWEETKTLNGGTSLLTERKKMLLEHGAEWHDKSVLNIYYSIFKINAKLSLNKARYLLSACTYYGAVRYLPSSNTKLTKWVRPLRRNIASYMFDKAGDNINIERNAYFGSGKKVRIGDNSGIGVNCKLFGTVVLGNNIMMGQNVQFITTGHEFSDINVPMIKQGLTKEKSIVVSDDVWIGSNSIILPGVNVGKGVVIGAGSIVTKDIPDYVVVAGNPASIVKNRK
ncbi:glycosyltransferase [Amphritea balenae]|uniref:Glycosyltransferase n=1 Tax=Amphritea balenae TaxID=452629 RepID=A0A3P1SST8_9GAMM|nr:glycosyltransferase [Amphritea balenae]RRD00198.1 glycosyltransferase [Amphritea balenae]GGK77510.1 hypothetical protein GCM10007941_29530 [Amphritea balenae]